MLSASILFAGSDSNSYFGKYNQKTKSIDNDMEVTQTGDTIGLMIEASSASGSIAMVESTGALSGDTARFNLADDCVFLVKFQKATATVTTSNCGSREGVMGIYYSGKYKKTK
jgi:hypothetical protein